MEPRRLSSVKEKLWKPWLSFENANDSGRSSRTGYRNFEVSDEDIESMLAGEEPLGKDLKSGMKRTLVDQPNDEDLMSLVRLGCKMATGSGKTVVMASDFMGILQSWKKPSQLGISKCCIGLLPKPYR